MMNFTVLQESHSNSSIQHEPALALHNLSLSSLADSHTRPASNNLYDNLKSLNPPTLRNNNVQKFVPSYKHSDQSGVPSSGVLEGRAPPKLRLELGRVYKPEDIAQYILDTGDEKGIAQVVAEMVEDGRVKVNLSLIYLILVILKFIYGITNFVSMELLIAAKHR